MRKPRPSPWLPVLLTTALVAIGSNGWAQQRSGLVGGMSVGFGGLGLHGTTGDPAVALLQQGDTRVAVMGFDAHIGRMMGRNTAGLFAITGDFEPGSDSDLEVLMGVGDLGLTFDSSTTALGSGMFAAALQQWIGSRVWVRGGLGLGFLTRDFTLGTDDDYLTITLDRGFGPGVLAAAGIEVWQNGNFAADIEFHFTGIFLEGLTIDAPTVQVGFNWY